MVDVLCMSEVLMPHVGPESSETAPPTDQPSSDDETVTHPAVLAEDAARGVA